MPTGRATHLRRSMSWAPAPGARLRRAAGASPCRRRGTPTELIKTLVGALKPEASVLYLAGRDRKEVIEAALSDAFAVEVVEAYAAEARAAWRPAGSAGSRVLRRGLALFAPVGRPRGGLGQGRGRGEALP